jgi:hypothetical protein
VLRKLRDFGHCVSPSRIRSILSQEVRGQLRRGEPLCAYFCLVDFMLIAYVQPFWLLGSEAVVA